MICTVPGFCKTRNNIYRKLSTKSGIARQITVVILFFKWYRGVNNHYFSG